MCETNKGTRRRTIEQNMSCGNLSEKLHTHSFLQVASFRKMSTTVVSSRDVQIRLTISFSTEENGYSQKWLKNKESCLPLQLEKKKAASSVS